ncbi:glycosyltransferase family 2 protein [Faecousia sp.]|uniref:glycosyltransferase family 2 protein n=1 Tax=Faecousia sp. TaxID=2952921 RepID=UPI002A935069|nr:glycosyltransferase family 2 protein [Candidatus Faecousia sp.]
MLSVVIPAFNEQEMVPAAAEQIDGVLLRAGIPHELIFIDDGSRDATWAEIRAESERRDTVRGVHFSRNFRKEAAIFAGLQAADGDCVAVIDCDLQHPPEKLVEMYRLWEQGVEVVEGVKTDRGEESLAHRVAAKTFYRLISEATHIDMTRASDFKLLDRKAVNVLLSMREKRAFFRALSSWIGFRTAEVPYEVRERAAGESKWSTWLLIKYALSNITAFTSLPLHLITGCGAASFLAALIVGIVSIVRLAMGRVVTGLTGAVILLLFLSGLIMVGLGIIGYYLGNIYMEIQDRPRFIVSETCGVRKKS